ncbi:MAG: PA0069 family radical SAM protein [Acidobacteriota bacterium]
MADAPTAHRGRGAVLNPPNRFDTLHYEADPEIDPNELPSPQTQFLRDETREIIATNDSPDVGFTYSVNPYRGCEHGCVYCFARPTHEYLGLSSGLDFETKIFVKEGAPELLRQALSRKRWVPQIVAISGVTDPYQPIERRLELTRRCIEVMAEFKNPVVIITKNHLVTRDSDLLATLAAHGSAAVFLSVTTLDGGLANIMEPRASTPQRRLEAIATLSAAGVPCGVLVAPVIPAITDHEMPAIIAAAAAAGARSAGYTIVRLPYAIAPMFEAWLDVHFPDRKEKVLNRIRSLRNGELNDPRWSSRMRGEGIFADQVKSLFTTACRKAGIDGGHPELSADHFRKPTAQFSLFGN